MDTPSTKGRPADPVAAGRRSLAAGIAAAIGASACCLGPLVLVSLGRGGARVGRVTALEPYRPVFIRITVGFLVLAFYKLYVAPRRRAPGEACAVPAAKTSAPGKPAELRQVLLSVPGMTCAACPITVRKALENVDGVYRATVDFDSKSAAVLFDPGKTDVAALLAATANAGYPATVAGDVTEDGTASP